MTPGRMISVGVLLVLACSMPPAAGAPPAGGGTITCSQGSDLLLNFPMITADPTVDTGGITAQFDPQCTSDTNKPLKACVVLGPGSGDLGMSRRLVNTAPAMIDWNTLDFEVGDPAGQPWGTVVRETTLPVSFQGRIGAGQESRAGDYESVMAAQVWVSDKNQGCDLIILGNSAVKFDFNLTARVTVQDLCTVTATDLDFGVTTSLAVDRTATATIELDCTAHVDYKVSLDGGLHSAGPVSARRMQHANGSDRIGYELLDSPQGTLLGDGTGGTGQLSGPGTAATLTVHGRVPAQAIPPAGVYSDTVTATVEY